MIGIAAADVSTGEFRLMVTPLAEADTVLARFAPREIVVPKGADSLPRTSALDGVLVTEREGWEFDQAMARDDLARHFDVRGLDGLGLDAGGWAGNRRRWRTAALPEGDAAGRRAAARASNGRTRRRRHAARRDDAAKPRARGIAARRGHDGHRCSPCSIAR